MPAYRQAPCQIFMAGAAARRGRGRGRRCGGALRGPRPLTRPPCLVPLRSGPARARVVPRARAPPSAPCRARASRVSRLAGFLPFSAIYIELHYIFASVWGHKLYTLYGVLALAVVLLLLVTAFITIALTYFQLAIEDHRWWWRSFCSGGERRLACVRARAACARACDPADALPTVRYARADAVCLPHRSPTRLSGRHPHRAPATPARSQARLACLCSATRSSFISSAPTCSASCRRPSSLGTWP